MNVTQCEGHLSTDQLNGGSMTTSQSEGKNKKKKIKKDKKDFNAIQSCCTCHLLRSCLDSTGKVSIAVSNNDTDGVENMNK